MRSLASIEISGPVAMACLSSGWTIESQDIGMLLERAD